MNPVDTPPIDDQQPGNTPPAEVDSLVRIADALERIARSLEAIHGSYGLLVEVVS